MCMYYVCIDCMYVCMYVCIFVFVRVLAVDHVCIVGCHPYSPPDDRVHR